MKVQTQQDVMVRKDNPTQGDIHINVPLTNMTVAYFQSETNFVSERVFPTLSVDKQSNSYFIFTRSDFNRDSMQLRADGDESRGDGWTLSSDTYFCDVWALHKDIGGQTRANADTQIGLDFTTTKFLSLRALLRKEVSWITDFFTTGVWDNDASFGSGAGERTRWDDDSSDPLKDVSDFRLTVLEATGFDLNTLTINARVWEALKRHPDILDRLKYGQTPGQAAMVNLQTVAALFELDRILVMKSIRNTAAEGAAESNSFIAGNHGLLTHTPATPGRAIPSAGYTFGWTGYTGASPMGTRIRKWYSDDRNADRIEIELAYDQKQTGSDLGYFMQNLVTTPS